MEPHFVIAINRSHIRFLEESLPHGSSTPKLVAIETVELTDAKPYPAARAQAQASGAPSSILQRMAIPERLPFGREQERHIVHDIASRVNAFLLQHPEVRWRLVASADLGRGVLDFIASPFKERMMTDDEFTQALENNGTDHRAAV